MDSSGKFAHMMRRAKSSGRWTEQIFTALYADVQPLLCATIRSFEHANRWDGQRHLMIRIDIELIWASIMKGGTAKWTAVGSFNTWCGTLNKTKER
jgi:hypothetical protein